MAKTKAQLERELADMTARAEAAEAAKPKDNPEAVYDERMRTRVHEKLGQRSAGAALVDTVTAAKWWPKAISRAVGPVILGVLIGGTIILIGGDEGRENEQGQIVTAADKAENAFIELVGHLPTIGLILLISLAADFIAKWVMAQGWFDQHGAAQELGTVRSRIGTEGERPQDGMAAGLGFVGNRLFAAAVALALLLHFG